MYNYKWLGKHVQIHIQSWYYANYVCKQLMEDPKREVHFSCLLYGCPVRNTAHSTLFMYKPIPNAAHSRGLDNAGWQ